MTWRNVGSLAGRVSKLAGYAAAAAGAIVLGAALLSVAVPGVATAGVALGAISTAAAAVQWIAGSKSGNKCDRNAGMIGTTVGLLTMGTWGALGDQVGTGAAKAGFDLYENASRGVFGELPAC